jgi:hypothetical protein
MELPSEQRGKNRGCGKRMSWYMPVAYYAQPCLLAKQVILRSFLGAVAL